MPEEYICLLEHPDGRRCVEWLNGKKAYLELSAMHKQKGYKERLSLNIHRDTTIPDVLLTAYLTCADYVNGAASQTKLEDEIKKLQIENSGIRVLSPKLHRL